MSNSTNTFNPKVSIIIPVYNGSDFLQQAIDSALAQTYNNIEVIIVNDGSNDEGATEKIALSYGDKIRYFNKPNGGVATALNLGIEKMSGEYFSWLSHDDLYLKDKIEQQIKFLTSLPKESIAKTIVYSDFHIFTTDPEKIVPMVMPGVTKEYFRTWITYKTNLHGCTLLIPKKALLESGRFNEKLRTTQDYDLWFRMAENYYFVYRPGFTVKARNHSGQGTIKMSNIVKLECNDLFSKFITQLTSNELKFLSEKSSSLAYGKIAGSYWRRGYFSAARIATIITIRSFQWSESKANIIALGLIVNGLTS